MKYNNRFLFLTLAMFFLFGCGKELSVETGGSGLPGSGGGGGGGNQAADYGWTFTGKQSDNYHGCIDTAFYQAVGPGKALFIQGTDSVGNNFIIALVSTSGKVTAGTYSFSQGASLTLQDQNGNTFQSKPPSPFSLQLTRVNDTIAEGNFSGTLVNPLDNTTLAVSNGKFKALIGKENPCGISTGGSGGGGSDAAFSLTSSGTSCSNPFIDGEFYKNVPLDASNTVELDVNVTVPGDWQVTTTAVNGMTFSGSGNFSSTGPNTIELTGTGTPTTTGNNVIPIQAGTSTCSFTVSVAAPVVAVPGPGDYFPTTANSYWVYLLTEIATGDTDSVTTVSTGTTKNIGGQTYSIFSNDVLENVYRKSSGNYYRYGSLDYVGFLDTSFKETEVIFLKENAALSASWESPLLDGEFILLPGVPVKFKRVFTIVEKNVSKVVNGVIYNNVITVSEVTMYSPSGGTFQRADETLMSYAKGIGLIKVQNDDVFEIKIDLKRFQVY